MPPRRIQCSGLPSKAAPDFISPPQRPIIVRFLLTLIRKAMAVPAVEHEITVQNSNPAATFRIRTDEPRPAPAEIARDPIEWNKRLNITQLLFSRQFRTVRQCQITLVDINRNGVRTNALIMEIDMRGFFKTSVPLKPAYIELSETINIVFAHRQFPFCN